MSKKQQRLPQDILDVLSAMECSSNPIRTPKGIASQTGIPYRRVLMALNTIHAIQRANPAATHLVGFDGTQYQSYCWAWSRFLIHGDRNVYNVD